MPHTTTKATRTKRPDTRPNGKVRVKANKKIQDSLKIQDLRVTKVQKEERKERVAQVTELKQLSKDEKLLRALKKKLIGIQDLMEKQKEGVQLDPQQLIKVSQLDQVLLAIEELTSKE